MPNHQLNDTNRGGLNVYLQSDNASQSLGESSKVFEFQNSIHVPPDQDIIVAMTNFSMANTLYNINLGFNDLVINNESLIIPPANYTAYQLYETINELIEDNISLSNIGVAVSFNAQTYKFSFTANSIINISACGFAFELGLENQLPTDNFLTYTANDTCMLGGLDTLYVKIGNIGIENLGSKGEIENTISSLNIRTNSGYYVFYDEPEHHYFLCTARNINRCLLYTSDAADE